MLGILLRLHLQQLPSFSSLFCLFCPCAVRVPVIGVGMAIPHRAAWCCLALIVPVMPVPPNVPAT